MRAIVVPETGGPEVLNVTEVADPQPGPGRVLVSVAAAGVNFIDTYQRSGLYPMQLPFTPGAEGAGRVLAVEVRRLNGDRGVEVVYDGVGAATFEASLASLRPRGMLVSFGNASGPVPPFSLLRLSAAGSLYVTRPT